jgi:hypothetical protein
MESEMPPFSSEQDKGEPELPQSEAITALIQAEIQALKQVEMVSIQLFQALERQMVEVETLITQVKKHRDIPKPMKKSYKELYWWSFVAGDIKAYGDQCESYRTWLEGVQETYDEKLLTFKQLQEDINNLYPQ